MFCAPSESVALDLNPRPTRMVLALVSKVLGSKSSCLSYKSANSSLQSGGVGKEVRVGQSELYGARVMLS